MSVSAKIAVLVDAMKHGSEEIEQIPPAERGRLAAVLRWLATTMEPVKNGAPKEGLLHELKTRRAHE